MLKMSALAFGLNIGDFGLGLSLDMCLAMVSVLCFTRSHISVCQLFIITLNHLLRTLTFAVSTTPLV